MAFKKIIYKNHTATLLSYWLNLDNVISIYPIYDNSGSWQILIRGRFDITEHIGFFATMNMAEQAIKKIIGNVTTIDLMPFQP